MANNVGQDIKKAVTNVFETMKTSLKAIIGIVKLVAKLIGQLVGAGPPGWVVLLVIVAVVILIIVLYAFLGSEAVEKNSTTNATNGHDKYDAQEMINDATFADRKDTQKEMNDLRKQLKEDLKPEELQGIEDGLQELSDKLATYTSHHFASYDTNAGYQALSNEVNILLMLERLTYAYTFTDWEPDYIGIKNVEDKIAELKEELEKEKSESKKLDLEEDIKKLENTLEQLELKYNKFLELNREYKKKYKKDFIDSDKKSKISPDGRPLETKVISYFKSKYGEDLSETMEELSYFHTIIKRQFIYSKSFTGLSDCSKIEEWLKDPTYTEDELVSETNTWQSLAAIEEVYRVNWELMHHEAVLKQIMYYDTIGNNVLTDSVALEQLKKALSSHMPIFQYVTYDKKVIEKTFYDYELYDNASPKFDSQGNYIYSSDFDVKLAKYTNDESYDIDFSKVSERAGKEHLLEQYEIQLENQNKKKNKDTLLILEIEQAIAALKDELEDGKTAEELKTDYDANYDNFTESMIKQDDDTRIYDPKNHDIIVDDSGSYYIEYAEKEVDSYNESTSIHESMTSMLGRPTGYEYEETEWSTTDDAPNESECERVIDAQVSTTMFQSSLKPLAVRTIFNSVDYDYSKVGERKTDAEGEIEKARKNVSWEKREVKRRSVTENADGTTTYGEWKSYGFEYQRNVTASILNYEAYIVSARPNPDNENILLDNVTYITDFYGQKQILTSSLNVQTPGGIAEVGKRKFIVGKADIIKYYQTDYNGPYGNSTIKKGGCGPTALAMVVDSLTDANNGVVAMCNWSVENGYKCYSGGSYWSLIPDGAQHFGLTVKGIKRTDKEEVIAALGTRKHPIIMICGPGDFTKSGHFIVLTGIDENGNVSINDPASRDQTSKTHSIDKIMSNASSKQGSNAVTFWEIY